MRRKISIISFCIVILVCVFFLCYFVFKRYGGVAGDNGLIHAKVTGVDPGFLKVSSFESGKGRIKPGDILILMLPTVSSKGVPDNLSDGDIVLVQYNENSIKTRNGVKEIEVVYSIYSEDELAK